MRVLFDTNVIVSALIPAHSHYSRARPWLLKAKAGEIEGVICTHALAEAYSALTTIKIKPHISPGGAQRMLAELVERALRPLPLTASDYQTVIEGLAKTGMSGGIIYDALIVRTARKAGVDRLLTFNLRHFQRIWPDDEGMICEP